jgi:hypothetical protein
MANLGDIFSGFGAAKQNKTLSKQLAVANKTEQARLDPYAANGVGANGLISSILGLGKPGDTSGGEALNKFRESTGYQDTMNTALNGVTSNAAARGLLGSSGTGQIFQKTGAQIAQGSFGDYLSQLMDQQDVGMKAAGQQNAVAKSFLKPSMEAYAKSKGATMNALGSITNGIQSYYSGGGGGNVFGKP